MQEFSLLVPLLPIYGSSVMILLLNVHLSDFTKKKTITLLCFSAFAIALNLFILNTFDAEIYRKFYILWIQLPVFIAFCIITRYSYIKILFTLLTMITLCSLPVLFVIIFRIITLDNTFLIMASFLISYIIMLLLVYFLLRPNFNYMLDYGENRSFLLFSLIPLLYYLYNFSVTGYNFIQFTELNNYIVHRIPDMIVVISYILIVDIFKKTNEKHLLINEQALLANQTQSAREQIEYLKSTQEQTMLYRHDMRHHLHLLKTYLSEGNIENAEQYLTQAQKDIDAITPIRYCVNETANLVFASFVARANEKAITLSIYADLPIAIALPETELCSLLANGLENALNATANVLDKNKRIINIHCSVRDKRLLISMENPIEGYITIEDGLPKTTTQGHGFGTKSMATIARKRKGYCACETKDHTFSLKIVIPLP